ncbi:MAG TPA: helicase HerA-like domain-containing protein, partial [Burkholderiales bacterium]|nr:helicase HerA-like domain-containing protein [Burkholderiales bacterium]
GPVSVQERHDLIARSPMKGKYDTAVDAESAYEMLQKRVEQTAAPASEGEGGGGILGKVGSVIGDLFGTSRQRGTRLSTGQLITREVTRSVANRVAGKIAADVGKSLGGSVGGSIGRAIVRGTLGGILRR